MAAYVDVPMVACVAMALLGGWMDGTRVSLKMRTHHLRRVWKNAKQIAERVFGHRPKTFFVRTVFLRRPVFKPPNEIAERFFATPEQFFFQVSKIPEIAHFSMQVCRRLESEKHKMNSCSMETKLRPIPLDIEAYSEDYRDIHRANELRARAKAWNREVYKRGTSLKDEQLMFCNPSMKDIS